MPDICSRPAAWVILSNRIRHPFCAAHINPDTARRQRFKVLKAKKGEKCNQSMNIERALLAYGEELTKTQDAEKATQKAKEEWEKD